MYSWIYTKNFSIPDKNTHVQYWLNQKISIHFSLNYCVAIFRAAHFSYFLGIFITWKAGLLISNQRLSKSVWYIERQYRQGIGYFIGGRHKWPRIKSCNKSSIFLFSVASYVDIISCVGTIH